MRPGVVVVGSLNMDFVVRADHLPGAGETVLGHGFRTVPGGKGANQAVAAARLAAGRMPVRMIGRVGLDAYGDRLKAGLSGAGVDVSSVSASRTRPTGVAFITVDSGGENQIVVAPGANADLAVADAEAMRRVFRTAGVALFQLETPVAVVAAAMRAAREEGLLTILDPAPSAELPPGFLGLADIVTPNEAEARALAGGGVLTPVAAAERISASGARTVVLKLGAEGCFALSAGGSFQVPAFAVNAVDTTAAGDTFNGALAVGLAEGLDLASALRFASAAAAISVTREGAQPSVPARAEVDAFLAAH